MSRMLRHVPTGDLYIFTAILAKRADMELVPEEAPVVEVVEPEVVVEVAMAAVEVKSEPAKKAGNKKEKAVQSAETLSIDIEE